MIKLNDNNIQVGQIKQILAEFNLPKCPVGEEYKEPDKHYIKDNSIYLYKKLKSNDSTTYESVRIESYIFGKKYLNLTTNLNITNLLYDRDTHRYLGRYLRFLKNYKGIDLMSLYNYFDQESLNERFSFTTNVTSSKKETVQFDSNDKNFMYYQIPIDFEKYTLFFNSHSNITGCLHVVNYPRSETDFLDELHKTTYFNSIIIDKKSFNFSKTSDWYESFKNKEELLKYKDSLYLVLKIPKSYSRYIVLLLGDYTRLTASGFAYKNDINKKVSFTGHWFKSKLNTYLNNENYLLSDKIIQYLTGNVITPLSEDYDLIKSQKLLISTNYMNHKYLGIWEENDLCYLKNYITKRNLQKKNDVIGYIDSDIERSLLDVKDGGIV